MRFASGASGTVLNGRLAPGASQRFLLNARDGQMLEVQLSPRGPALEYQIFNPDGSFLLEQIDAERPYRGQLWQSGDHVVEVINRNQSTAGYRLSLRIE